MTPIGHLAIGFAAKRSGLKIPLYVYLLAAWLIDFLYLGFTLVGIESAENFSNPGAVPSPWSHGLFMAVIWSLAAGLAAARIYRSRPAGGVLGLVVFSHWVLDFISWDNLLVFFPGSPEVGLGLFSTSERRQSSSSWACS
jgi:hypothetical protein